LKRRPKRKTSRGERQTGERTLDELKLRKKKSDERILMPSNLVNLCRKRRAIEIKGKKRGKGPAGSVFLQENRRQGRGRNKTKKNMRGRTFAKRARKELTPEVLRTGAKGKRWTECIQPTANCV